ncbi:MAG: histidine phosphatase family protein [Candidatus Nanopelagicales bacterium]
MHETAMIDGVPTLLLLIRHAEQVTLREVDPPLSERGLLQADLVAVRLGSLPLTAIVSSPLERARQTARPLAERTGLEVEILADLSEAGLSSDDMRHVFTNTSARHMEPDPFDYVGPARAAVDVLPRFVWGKDGRSETGGQIRHRMTAALDVIAAQHPGGIVACFSHGGAINAATAAWLGIDRDMWFVPWHTGITALLIHGERRTQLFVNDSSHLDGGEDALGLIAGSLDFVPKDP